MVRSFSNKELQVSLLFIGVFLSDVFTRLWLKNDLNISLFFKAFFMVYILYYLKKDKFQIIILVLIGYILLCLGMVFNYQSDFSEKTSQFFEYYSGILLFTYLTTLKSTVVLDKLIAFIFSIYIINIIVAFVFQIEFFKTYPGSDRFGYMPLFNSQNEFSFIMISILAYSYKKLSITKNIINYLMFFSSILAALCIGTKVVYLFLFLLMNFILFNKIGYIKYLVTIIVFAFVLFFSRNLMFVFLNEHFYVVMQVYENNGVLDAISSLRLSYLPDRIECNLNRFDFINYLFGGEILTCITEMSIWDLLLFFGIIGTAWFFYLQRKLLLRQLNLDSFGAFFIVTIALLSFVGGYFFENFSAQLYAITFLYLYYYKKSPTIKT